MKQQSLVQQTTELPGDMSLVHHRVAAKSYKCLQTFCASSRLTVCACVFICVYMHVCLPSHI